MKKVSPSGQNAATSVRASHKNLKNFLRKDSQRNVFCSATQIFKSVATVLNIKNGGKLYELFDERCGCVKSIWERSLSKNTFQPPTIDDAVLFLNDTFSNPKNASMKMMTSCRT